VDEVIFRDSRDDDAQGLIALIGGVFAEYPGCVLDVDGELPELRAIASYFREKGGRFWVAERGGEVIACVGLSPRPDRGVELHKLYVRRDSRRQGMGSRLCQLVESTAQERGASHVELWTDTRFQTAHLVYQKRGYLRGSTVRELHDKSATVEYYYRKDL
jgi:putative acetyltransferase